MCVNVASAQSPLSSLISNIGQGTKTVNNSVVNISLNVLIYINIDEMIDDDEDEERKFLIKELEKKANTKKSHTAIQNGTGEIPLHISGVKPSRSNSLTNNRLLSSPNVTHPQTTSSQSLLSQLNITLSCHYCWAQFQLNVSKKCTI